MKIPSNVANPLTSINSGEFTYDYDKGRRLSSVTCPWPKAVGSSTPEQMSYLYYANNWLNTYNDSQFETTYTYDARGFVNSLTNTSNLSSWSGDIISAFPRPSGTLVRDAMGNLGGYTSELPEYGVHVNDASRIVGYTYNTSNSPATANLDQLTGETSEPDPGIGGSGFSDTYTNDFGYDAAWNDTTYDISGSSIGTITFDADNQISVSGSTYSFDGDGNPTTYGGKTFNFDPEDRFTYLSSPSFSASYDGDGLRTIAQPAGSTVYFVYDGDFPVAEETYSSSTASLAAVNAFGADGWRQRCYYIASSPVPVDDSAFRSFGFDPQGNVTNRSDTNVTSTPIYDTAMYEAYGKRDSDFENDNGSNPATSQDPARWGGQRGYYTDGFTNLAYCVHRYYDFHNGRFLTRDPIGYNGGVNLYAFGDNPVNQSDPTGLSPWNPFDTEFAVIGGQDVLSHNNVAFVAGWGDELSMGATDWLRGRVGANEMVQHNSAAYHVGEATGFVQGLAFGAAGAGRNALLQAGRQGGIVTKIVRGATRIVSDDREWGTVRSAWSRAAGGLLKRGQSLHHVFVPQRATWVPQAIRNAGLNYLPVSSSLNAWMNGSTLARHIVEWTFRGVAGALYASPANYLIHH